MRQTILSVDGDAAVRSGRNDVLRAAGFEILETGTAADALRLAFEHQPTLIVLAIELSGADGFAVSKQLKADPRTAAIPVLQISRDESHRRYLESLESGAEGYLHEPVEPPVLVGAVTALIRACSVKATTGRAERDAFAKHTLAALIESIPDEVWFADAQGKFTLANPSALREFGMSAPTLVGVEELAKSLEVFRADGTPRPVEEAPPLRALAGETVRSQEEIVRTPVHGELRYRQVSASPVRDAAGNVVGSVSVVRDITERKRAEAKAEESRAKLEAALESMTDAVFISDAQGRLTHTNEAFATYHRFKNKEECSKSIAECPGTLTAFLPDGTPAPPDMWALPRALRGETVTSTEYTLRRKDTGETWVGNYSFGPIRGEDGAIVGAVVVARDVTGRKKAEELVSRSQKTFSELVERAPFGIYIVDSQFRIAHMNAGSQDGAFRNVRPAIGRDLGEAMRILWPEPVAAEVIAHFRHTLETGEPFYSPPFFNPRHDVEAVEGYEWELHRMTLPDGQFGVICYYFDSTKLRQAEAAARESEEKYRALFESIEQGFCTIEVLFDENEKPVDYRFLLVNPAFERQTGIRDASGRRMRQIAPLHEEHWFQLYGRIAMTGEPLRFENPAAQLQRYYEVFAWRIGAPAERTVAILFNDISERKRTEAVLREREDRLSLALEAADLGTWDLDLLTGKAVRSLRHDQIFGYRELQPEWTFEIALRHVLPEDREKVREAYAPAIGKAAMSVEARVRRSDGALRWIVSSGRFHFDGEGRAVRIVGVVADITERREAEEALRRSEARWNAAIENLGEGAIIATEAERVIYWNPAARAMHGFTSAQEGIGPLQETPNTFELWTPDGRRLLPLDEWPMRRVKRGETVHRLELRLRRPGQGWEKIVAYSGAMVETASGERLIFLSVYDLTEQREAERAFRESESRLRTLTDNLPEAAIYRYRHDAHGEPHIDFISAGIERLTGVPAAEYMADHDTMYRNILPEDHERLKAAIALSRDRLEQFEVEVRHPHRITGETRWSLLRSTPTRNPDGSTTWDGIELDITERRRAEAKLAERTIQLERTAADLEERNREVERVNRMKTEFLSRSSHELRTPLNAIVGYTDLLAEQPAGPLPPPYPRFVANIQEGARHLLAMVNDLLDISRIEAGHIDLKRESFRPADVLEEVFSVIAPLAKIKHIPIDNAIPGGMSISADRTRFKQVLFNLVSNAVKFTPENGRVWIADASCDDAAGFCVGDTGIGIPGSELESIFVEFHQVGGPANVAREGTGLGLSITRRLVELHGGTIGVESTVGQGSRFTFTLGAHSLVQPTA